MVLSRFVMRLDATWVGGTKLELEAWDEDPLERSLLNVIGLNLFIYKLKERFNLFSHEVPLNKFLKKPL